jgi:hypothetical protein
MGICGRIGGSLAPLLLHRYKSRRIFDAVEAFVPNGQGGLGMSLSKIWIAIGAFVLVMLGAIGTDPTSRDLSTLSNITLGGASALAQAKKAPAPAAKDDDDDGPDDGKDDDDGPDDGKDDDDGPDDDDEKAPPAPKAKK